MLIMGDDFSTLGAAALVSMLAKRQVSAVELFESAVSRIETLDPAINAVVVRDFERAREHASEADAALSRGDRKPLLGVPMTLKESFDVAGLATTWGLEAHRSVVPAADSAVVERLRAAGAVILGKTNVSEGLGSWHSTNPIFGTTVNPRHPGHSAGGSSGGSAAALAAGFTPLEVGSDIAGSIRVPAHFCGVFGHNSSGPLVPLRGHALNNRSARLDLSSPGPMARHAEDLDLGLSVLAGPEEDKAGFRAILPRCRHERLRDFRVIVLGEHPFVPTAPEIGDAVETLADRLRAAGVTVRDGREIVPDLLHLTQNYLTLLGAALSIGLPAEVLKARVNLHADKSSADAIMARAALISHHDWLDANEARAVIRKQWAAVFRDWDLVVCPSFSTTAPFLAEAESATATIDGHEVSRGDQVAWCALATGAGLPSTAMPVTTSAEGLPIGVQIIGPYFEDRTTIGFAKLLEQSFS
jgi:amidase